MNESDSDQIAQRRAKLQALRALGNPFPNDFRRDCWAQALQDEYSGEQPEALAQREIQVRVAGRLMAKRVMGKASFVHIQDASGRIQLRLERDRLGTEGYNEFKKLDLGDTVGVNGELFLTRTGELTVRADTIRLLTKALRPLPEKYHGLSDQELRYRQRYVDLIMNAGTRETFRVRSATVSAIRAFMTMHEFLEVETPMMQAIPGGAVARPFKTHHNALDMDLYLRIAPELYLKRLVVGGFERVFEINRNFRNEGISTQHNPEFTMLEFYQAYADYRDFMDLTEAMLRHITQQVLGTHAIEYQGESIDFAAPFARMTMEEAILQHNPGVASGDLKELNSVRRVAEQLAIEVVPSHGAGKIRTEIFEKTVEEKLQNPTFITGYPVEVSPLSRRNDDDPDISDRFELFITGREIANGFSELNDPEDQAERFREQAAAHAAGDDEAMHFDADYVRALEYGLPPTAGEGIGIDRLVMLLTDSPSIRDVLLFPYMRPESAGA
ncbi:MAG: lysine--tRNA ligase [Gammaproteobacteria bacterium]|nr:lysine--tRNA ligase [Gammaproteobacteria bacterium]MDH3466618.1 lysine--tRNA ligase [Gammaproteobacteria bacterium]